ncbi:lipid A deacylase LpxR family protein [Enterovibrio sp. ZSDZ35]|uniref:Lipid A deacylase LpxR family protein n=1 Tax=Enterovibrio qingdaonensis TaxID=2899818 RepID=A0ABT5QF52_9GAMM|nr:lipid A deacylase LpxR family protein [Enterovibrio sp. ZSDZ35]MDD1779612.1 lipid A deacylase LpxR family protein [Enterovibrio sp. ZSDZ35]
MFTRSFLAAAILAAPLVSFPIHAATVSLSVDNDGILGTDREYTSGLFLRWSSDPSTIGYSVEIGNQMWTPSDIEVATPQANERAYAGLLYLQGRTYHQNDLNAYKAGLMVGTVGPNSMAEEAQDIVHTIVGSPDPQGWDYQIEDEFVYQLSLEAHQLVSRSSLGEFSVYGRGQAGNYQSEAAVGGTYRYGLDLGSTLGSTTVIPGNIVDVSMLSHSSQGMFLFATLEARYRFNDITLDGDKPAANATTTLENTQGALSTGLAWYTQSWGATLAVTMESQQFEESKRNHHTFGNVTVFYRY